MVYFSIVLAVFWNQKITGTGFREKNGSGSSNRKSRILDVHLDFLNANAAAK